MGHHQLDALDEQILKLIAGNARIPFLEVARACNVSGAAIHQRIQKLTNLGILKGSEYVIDPEKIGYETRAYIGIYLKDPESFDSVTRALEAIPEVSPAQWHEKSRETHPVDEKHLCPYAFVDYVKQ